MKAPLLGAQPDKSAIAVSVRIRLRIICCRQSFCVWPAGINCISDRLFATLSCPLHCDICLFSLLLYKLLYDTVFYSLLLQYILFWVSSYHLHCIIRLYNIAFQNDICLFPTGALPELWLGWTILDWLKTSYADCPCFWLICKWRESYPGESGLMCFMLE